MIRLHSWKLLLLIFVNCSVLPTANCQLPTASYQLHFQIIDKDKFFDPQPLKLQTQFAGKALCTAYIKALPALLSTKGYPTASVDSITEKESFAEIKLFLGKQYHWIRLTTLNIDKKAIDESGYMERSFSGKVLNMQQLQNVEERILDYYEKNGYPFAEVFLDSIRLEDDKIEASLNLNKGVLYHIDSMRIFGKIKISNNFLQHYLGISRGAFYNREKLQQVSKRMIELPYVQELQPSDVTMLGTGAVLNLYLAPRRSSQANFLVGFLPGSGDNGKLQITADVNLNLKNILAAGETILVNWQQLQPKSPKLNLGYQKPYIFNSSFGFDFLFDLFKKDSSFLQVNAELGLQYILSAKQAGKVFMQWQNSFLLSGGVDTNEVKSSKKLPPNIDVSSVSFGLDYDWSNTDYRLNPRKGNEVKFTSSVGIKNIKQNNEITTITDPLFNYASLYDSVKARSYQLKIKLSASHFFPVGKQATVKAALNAGVFFSPAIFRNELFQIGGYRLLRGFDEESIYATQYSVATTEYRFRLALNSFLFGFVDGGWVRNKYQQLDVNNTFIGTGIGLAFETKFGVLNISYAVGKRDDVKFSIREASKIHFGYVNYF